MLSQPSGPTYYARLQFSDAAGCVGWLESIPLHRPAEEVRRRQRQVKQKRLSRFRLA